MAVLIMRLLLMLLIVLYAQTALASSCSAPKKLQQVSINEDNLVIAVMRVNNRPIADSIDLYAHDGTFFVAISQLGFLLDLPWHFDIDNHQFYSAYDNSDSTDKLCDFDISLKSTGTSSGYWYTDDFDTYIDVLTLSHLFVGEVNFNEKLQQLNFTSVEADLGLKKNKHLQINTFFNEPNVDVYPIVHDAYRLFSHPIVNYRITASTQRLNGRTNTRYQTNLNANLDLMGLASEYRFIHGSNYTANFAKFSKNIISSNSQNTLLGNLQTIDERAVKYEFGDITSLGDELVSSTKQMLGLHVYSHSQNQRRNFSSIQIEETVLPGWRAVLFRNGQFVAEQTADENNLIVFSQVATFIGINRFSIHLYGPQGQEEYRQKVVHVGQSQLQNQQMDFSLSFGDANKTLFNNSNTESAHYDKNLRATMAYGLNENLTAEVQWNEFVGLDPANSAQAPELSEVNTKPTRFLSTSFDYTKWSSLFRASYVHSNSYVSENGAQDAGQAFFLGVNSNIGNSITGNLSLKYLNDFESDKHSSTRGLRQELKLRLRGKVDFPFKMGLGFNFSEQRFKDMAVRRLMSINSSQQIIGGTLSNTLQYNEQGESSTLSHSMFLSHNIGAWQVSHNLSWLPIDGQRIERYSMNLRWPQQATTFNETRLSYSSSDNARLKLAHQLSWRTDYFNLQVGGSIDNKGHWNAQIGISGSLYQTGSKYSYRFDKVKGNSVRQIEAVAFIDNDRDGKLSDSDEPLSGIKFLGAADWRKQSTQSNGTTKLFTMSDYQAVSVDETSLEDPFLLPSDAKKIVASHAGGINRVYFPLLPVNDIEGSVVALKNGKEKGLLGLTVRLHQIDGELSWETSTQSDGYYFFTHIPPGKYKLLIDHEHLSRLGLQQEQEITVTASELGDIISVDTIALIEQNLIAKG